MTAKIEAIETFLPERRLTNAQLADVFPEWPAEKIEEKTGIRERCIADENECSSDLAVAAARKLFGSGVCRPEDIDYLLLCTQSPDYLLPTTACLVQHELGLRTDIGALDFNLGCSGFVYGLSLAQGLVASGQASRVLLITAETYSKFIHPDQKNVRVLFGDGAAATLITESDDSTGSMGPFVVGTDGSGAPNLILRHSGLRQPAAAESGTGTTVDVEAENESFLFMDGPEIFSFASREVPALVRRLLERAGTSIEDVDLFVFHQANKYMLEHLRRRLRIPPEKFPIVMEDCGNTVSASIPLALKAVLEQGRLHAGQRVMLVGFGVGYSVAATMLEWSASAVAGNSLARSA